ncbi:photosystem II repair protein Psb32 [Myxosarcina sp. GI1]|uniref:photosystem II repair protein Psb32 n=1 Tax=Myxosarcina sp. GI1 TaxID=1541065 RepID=UPI000AF5AFC1|nr:TPM domain-containing protein [Myxosarcina sp. GI1]
MLKRLIPPILLLVFAVFSLAMPVFATGISDLPNPNTEDVWVVDTADEISFSNESKLTSTFKKLAKETGQEVRMVAIRRLDYGETIDSLADKLFTTWYDKSERANQTLLVLDTLTNNAAIRTGEKAKKLVNEEIAKSLVNDTVGYDLRTGNKYNQAFLDSSDRLVAVLSGQEDPGPPEIVDNVQVEGTFTKAEDTKQGISAAWIIGFLVLATIIPMATYFWYVSGT